MWRQRSCTTAVASDAKRCVVRRERRLIRDDGWRRNIRRAVSVVIDHDFATGDAKARQVLSNIIIIVLR